MPPENLRKCFNCNLLKQYPANPWLCKLDQGLDFIIKDLSLSVNHNNCWPNFKWFSVLFLQIQPVLNNKGKVSCWRKQRGLWWGSSPRPPHYESVVQPTMCPCILKVWKQKLYLNASFWRCLKRYLQLYQAIFFNCRG